MGLSPPGKAGAFEVVEASFPQCPARIVLDHPQALADYRARVETCSGDAGYLEENEAATSFNGLISDDMFLSAQAIKTKAVQFQSANDSRPRAFNSNGESFVVDSISGLSTILSELARKVAKLELRVDHLEGMVPGKSIPEQEKTIDTGSDARIVLLESRVRFLEEQILQTEIAQVPQSESGNLTRPTHVPLDRSPNAEFGADPAAFPSVQRQPVLPIHNATMEWHSQKAHVPPAAPRGSWFQSCTSPQHQPTHDIATASGGQHRFGVQVAEVHEGHSPLPNASANREGHAPIPCRGGTVGNAEICIPCSAAPRTTPASWSSENIACQAAASLGAFSPTACAPGLLRGEHAQCMGWEAAQTVSDDHPASAHPSHATSAANVAVKAAGSSPLPTGPSSWSLGDERLDTLVAGAQARLLETRMLLLRSQQRAAEPSLGSAGSY